MKPNLLYVDDQRENLIVFRAAFGKKFNVLEASSASEALELFKKHEVPVMVADQRMPEMTGVELCEVVEREYPHTIRMILTGYIDTDAMMEAINKGRVYNFITKPWEPKMLLPILLRAFEAYDLALANLALHERLDHAGRCATLGWFAAGIAHEMKNQLFILPLVELLEEKCDDDTELLELSRIARQTHHRLEELINEVMDFVRGDDTTRRKISMNLADVVREAVSLASLDESIPKSALKLDVRAEPIVSCHKAKIQQVIFNLLRNAADATRDVEDCQITVTVEEEDGHALLSVSDNGPGIPPDAIDLIWEPFYSTKGNDGNGLGLDMCRRTMEFHDGGITCLSGPSGGARFLIRFPKQQDVKATKPYADVAKSGGS